MQLPEKMMMASRCSSFDFDAEYSLGEVLGSRAVAWKATIKSGEEMGEEVAVKLLSRSQDSSETPREASMLLMAGGHPNVLRLRGVFWGQRRLGSKADVEDFGCEDGAENPRQVMVTDFCEGGSLCRSLSMWGAFSSQDAAGLCHDLLQALAHIHSIGVVHRDVQPANILLRASGEAVLTGFALAACTWDKEELMKRCGAPGYIAPEVILNRGSSPASDAFSTGCTVCCALSGVGSPFEGADMVSSVRNTLMMQPNLAGSVEIESLETQGTAFLHGLLEKSPERRLTIAEALLDPWIMLF